MRQAFQSLESKAATALVSRMDAESEGDFNFRSSSDSEAVHEYRISMQNTMKKLSTTNCGYIVWLKLDPNSPPLEEIKAEKILPSGQFCNEICDKLKSAARRFTDDNEYRILPECHDKCSFKECRLSKREKRYIETLKTDPMKLANEVKDDWHPLPLSRLSIDPVCDHNNKLRILIAVLVISSSYFFYRNF